VKKLLAVPTSKHMCASCVCRRVARRSFGGGVRAVNPKSGMPSPSSPRARTRFLVLDAHRPARTGRLGDFGR
jgi:hypothetical protein